MAADSLDSRRFFRIDLPIHCWTLPTSRIVGCDIYATPTVYWTKQRELQVQKAKENALAAAKRLKSDADLMLDIYNDILKRLDIFIGMFVLLEQGKNPLESSNFRAAFSLLKQENQLLTFYEQSAPKTYTYIKSIYDKMAFYCIELIYLARHSTSGKLGFNKVVTHNKTAADIYIEKLRVAEFAHLDLPQFIIGLGDLVNAHLDAFGLFQQDIVNKNYPTRWAEIEANLSEGGIRFNVPKNVRQGQQICIAFYNSTATGIIGLKGLVVNSQAVKDSVDYQWRINFDFPDRTQQMLIQSIMNQHEIGLNRELLNVE